MQETAGVELGLQMLEQPHELGLGRWPGAAGAGGYLRGAVARLEPFVGDQQHRVGQIQRRKGRIQGHHDEGLGQHHVVVAEARPLGPEQHAGLLAPGEPSAHVPGRPSRRDDGLDHVAGPGRRRVDMAEIGDRRGRRIVKPRALEHRLRPRGGGNSLVVGPALTRPDQPQVGEPAVEHGPRRGADVVRELGLDQDHRRTAPFGHRPRRLPARIGAGHHAFAPARNSL